MSAVFEVGGKIPGAPGGLVFSNGISIPTAAQPTFSPSPGTYSGTQTVTLTCSTPSSTIYYTLDGSAPTFPITGSTTQYTGALTVSATETIKAIGTAPGFNNSGIATGAYTITAGSGFLPAGHFINAKQAMIQVYPRPNSETNTFARHRWAYYDAVNPVQYSIPLGVSFGAFPYVYQLLSGPPGMSIGATFWNTSWTGFAQAMAAGYGYLNWTPTGSVTNSTVSILVTDQQMNTLTITFTISTSSSTSQFIFLDAVNGSDSNAGTISSPWQSFTKANGTTYNTTNNANALCYLRQGTYSIPASTANSINSGDILAELNTTIKPSAWMGFPGDTPPILTMSAAQFATGLSAGVGFDLFMQGLNPNGACTLSGMNGRIIWVAGDGSASARQTFDNIAWSNPVFGSGGSNATGYFFDGADSTLSTYQFVNNCSESNRQSGQPGNNYIGCSFYGAQFALVQGFSIVQSGLEADGCCYFKIEVQDGCIRGCTANLGTGTPTHAFDFGQPLLSGDDPTGQAMSHNETCYNTLVSGSGGIFLGFGAFTFDDLWCYRNSVIGINSYKTNCIGGGPLVYDSNAGQGGAIPTGSIIQTDGLNIVQASGLLNTSTGLLTPAFSADVGLVGAQIA